MWCETLLVTLLSRTKLKVNTVEQVMFPVTLFGWIVGMGIIEFPMGNPWPVASFIYTLVLTVAYGCLVEINIENMETVLGGRPSDSSKFIYKALFYGNVALYLCGTILGWARVKGVKKIVERLESSDARMEKMGISRDYSLIYVRQLSMLVSQFVVIFVFTWTAIMWSGTSGDSFGLEIAYSFASYYPVVLTAVGDISYVTLVRFMGMRFCQLNKCLTGMLTTTIDSPQHKRVLEYTKLKAQNREHVLENRTNDDENAMRAARVYHHELVGISNMINDTFGVQVLLSMTVSFALITGLLYNTCGIIMWEPDDENITEDVTDACCWLAFYIYRIILINACCDITSTAAKETGNIICQLHEPSTRKAFRNEILDFTMQVSQHTLTFTACGFFTLNYGFIQGVGIIGMVGSITTYLVILIQIGDIEPSQFDRNMTNWNMTNITNGSIA